MHLEDHYFTLNTFYQQKYGTKVYKIAVDGGFTCPNRDGTLGDTGCIFCSREGSGDFAITPDALYDTIEALKASKKASKFIVYFQSFTNTYGPVSYLKTIYESTLTHPDIVGISIATRPDCLSSDVVEYLSDLNKRTDVYVELGLQTIHEKTAVFIRSGFTLADYELSVIRLKNANIPVITHLIIGLPGETVQDMFASVDYVCNLHTDGIKLQLLHVLKGTDLGDLFQQEPFPILSEDEYIRIVVACIKRIPKHIVIHRITGDGSRKDLIEPLWSLNKKKVLNAISKALDESVTSNASDITRRNQEKP